LTIYLVSSINRGGTTPKIHHIKELVMADFDDTLDATGLNCPLPILRAKKALKEMEPGRVLRIIATDPGAVKDFEVFAKHTNNELLSSTEEGGKFIFLIRKDEE